MTPDLFITWLRGYVEGVESVEGTLCSEMATIKEKLATVEAKPAYINSIGHFGTDKPLKPETPHDGTVAQQVRTPIYEAPKPHQAEDADGWIPWSGGECPVARQYVRLRMSDGDEFATVAPETYRWYHRNEGRDIIAYKVVNDSAPKRIHPDVLAAHAEFGGDLEDMQKRYDAYDIRSRQANAVRYEYPNITQMSALEASRGVSLAQGALCSEQGAGVAAPAPAPFGKRSPKPDDKVPCEDWPHR